MKKIRKSCLLAVLLFCFLLPSISTFGESKGVIRLNSIQSVNLTEVEWRYHPGDNPNWKSPTWKDQSWSLHRPVIRASQKDTFPGIGWFRLRIVVDSSLYEKRVGLQLMGWGAAEIFWNGKKIHQWGTPASSKEKENILPSGMAPLSLTIPSQDTQLLAVRYSYQNISPLHFFQGRHYGFRAELTRYSPSLQSFTQLVLHEQFSYTMLLQAGFYFAICVVFLIYFFINLHKWNAFTFAIFCLTSGLLWLSGLWVTSGIKVDPFFVKVADYTFAYVTPIWCLSLSSTLYFSFYNRLHKMLWFNTFLAVLTLVILPFSMPLGYLLGAIIGIFILIDSLRVIGLSFYYRKAGRWIIGLGIILFLLLFTIARVLTLTETGLVNVANILFILSTFSAPLAMAIFISYDYAVTNQQRIQQAEEKREILANQREKLARQVEEQTREIQQQKEKIEESHQQIVSSIEYASRIQSAILPEERSLQQLFPDYFVLYQPRDVVSGDFYWTTQIDKNVIFTVADCTGHGVPGAFMSMIGNDLLNHIVKEGGEIRPKHILEQLDQGVINALKQRGQTEEMKDGMDLGLCSWQPDENTLTFAGAHNPLYLIRDGELQEYEGSPLPIGSYFEEKSFEQKQISLKEEDSLYLFSDGFPDQFGGPKGKKFMYKRFKQLLLDQQDQSMEEQKRQLKETLQNWMDQNNEEQLDDICVMGIKI